MTRFYKKRTLQNKSETKYFIIISLPNGSETAIEVSESVYFELDDMQKYTWRKSKAESRNTYSPAHLPEHLFPKHSHAPSAEQLLLERIQRAELFEALRQLPPLQLKRFLLKNYFDLSINHIAQIERCSAQSIRESLMRAKKNLQKKLGE